MQKYRFGDFELDLDDFELRCNGERVRLERRPMDLLALLAQKPGRVILREEIIAALWPQNVIIDFDSGLNTLVLKVRNALGDSSEAPKFIETVPGRGYRFTAPITAVTKAEPDLASAAHALPDRSWPARRVTTSLALLLVIAVGLITWFATDSEQKSLRIAFPPIRNLTGDDSFSPLAFTIAQDAGQSLGQIDPDRLQYLDVSALTDFDPARPIGEIDRELDLDLDLVVPCSLYLDQTRISLQCQLLRVSDGGQIWADTFPRARSNTIGVSQEFATAVTTQIKLKLTPEVTAAIERHRSQNEAAYALYQLGRDEWVKLTPRSTQLAIEYFQQATDEDPEFELAWAGLAFAAITSIRIADFEPVRMREIARDALKQVERLGPTLAESWYARGYYSLFGDLDSVAAAAAAEQAIDLDPYNAQALMLLGVSLQVLGDVTAREVMRQAREYGSNFALVFANSANVALQRGELDEALELARDAIAINEEFWLGYHYAGRALEQQGDYAGALAEYEAAAKYSEGHSLTYSFRADLLVNLGRMDEAEELLAELTTRAADPERYAPRFTLGAISAQLGETEKAFEWLAQAVEVRDVNLSSMPTDPRLRSLWDDPRWTSLLDSCDCTQ